MPGTGTSKSKKKSAAKSSRHSAYPRTGSTSRSRSLSRSRSVTTRYRAISKSRSGPKHNSATTLSVSNHLLNPINVKNRIVAAKLKRDADIASLSAQAAASIFRDDLAERIPRDEAEEHMRLITSIAPTAMIAGSFRRGAQTGNDIDVVIREPIELVLEKMHSIGYIKHTFSSGKYKFSGVVKLPNRDRFRHLDIVMTTPRAYPFAMLYFTGSKKHNIIMRLKAKRLGLKLNEYGLFRGHDLVPGIETERDIFAALGIEYREPNERN